jgi:hypothetical protein
MNYSATKWQVTCRALRLIVEANKGRRGFTFTHYDVLTNLANRQAIADANKAGFTINLSGKNLEHADRLADLRIAPVTSILPANTKQNTKTPKGRTVVICPTNTHGSTIIGFPASGGIKHRIQKEQTP